MTMYLTKEWGFGIPCGPLQFSQEGNRRHARSILKPNDLVVLVGTQGPPTDPNDQGRLLGIMEPTTEVVMWHDFKMQTSPRDFNNDGSYRWPFGLLNRKAWRFLEPRKKLVEVVTRKIHRNAASQIVELTPEEAVIIAKLPREEVALLASIKTLSRVHGEDAARRRSAPPPSTTRRGVMHLRSAPAYTYLMAIEGADKESYKIGWAFDHANRQRGFNSAALPQLGGLRYLTRLTELWETAREAFGMEQLILRQFNDARHPANREVVHGVTYDELQNAWIKHLLRARATG